MDSVRIGLLLLLGCATGWWAWERYQAPAEDVADAAPATAVPQPAAPELVDVRPDYDAIVEAKLRESAAESALATRPPAAEQRQTEFNDQNYVARQPDNILESRHISSRAGQAGTERRADGGPSGSATATFDWRDARRQRSRWKTRYEYHNGVIDTGSFCRNYRRGSIDYRTCRKGARAWLAERCGNGTRLASARQRMYCHAHSGFRL
ncbi:hypothetical protein [Halopseudomonas maritima]|uniref:hypothetical protein n=1 Tax=Halopseudomonas maritima TaxID=2918528 RepID=UPI001EEAF09A|nr:hypothetical protein [Halopseudomonas maritima]UJJ32318.1 hypothetical protein HV822_03900 [Halopseudomonas maritima]